MSQHRAPFLWTPRQPIVASPLVSLAPEPPRDDGKNRWFLFRTTVDLAAPPERAPTDITVDGRYILFVNGKQVGRGPVRCSPLAQRYDTYDLAPHLGAGRNVVAVLVHTYGVDTAFYEGARGLWRRTFGEGGLYVDGAIVDTRRPWRCLQSDAWTQETPRANHSLGFIEDFDAQKLPPDWTSIGFDDSDWDDACVLEAGGGGAEAAFGGLTVRPFPILRPRGIPALHETFVRASSLRWVKAQTPRPALPIHKRLYDEDLTAAAPEATHDINALLSGDGVATVRTIGGADTAVLLDFGRIFSGYPAFEIEARGDEVVEIACSERLPGEWSPEGAPPDARIARQPLLGHDAHVCRYVARPGVQTFQRYEWCAIRYMHVVVRNAPEGLRIRRLGAVETHYPVVARGRFSCSDPLLTKLWSTGAYTLRQCMHDGWEDCPSREQRQWLGDVTVENLAAWAAYGDSAAPLTAKFLIQAAESQRADGLTQMFAPGDHGEHALLIPDWTLQWILCAADHWRLTGDLATLDEIWPAIQKALGWFHRAAGSHGLVVDMAYWHFMDWAGVGRDHQALALNAQLAGAYRAAAVVGRAVGAERHARLYDERAAAIVARLDAEHWDERRGVWVDMVDPRTGVQMPRVSQHGVAALALWGGPSEERLARAFAWATDPLRETMTPAPPVAPHGAALDEENGVVMANTFYGHFVSEALAAHGRGPMALAMTRRRFGPMIAAGATTLWESMAPTASLCHGFSASPTWFLSRHVLGVAPAAPGFAKVRVTPDLMDLDHAEGAAPAGACDVSVTLTRIGDGFEAVIESDAEIDVAAPPGARIVDLAGRNGRTRAVIAKA